MTANHAILYAMATSLAGAPLAWAASRSRTLAGWIAFLATAAASGLALFAATLVLVAGPGEPVTVLALPALGSALRIQVDGLSAVFAGLVALIALLASLYSIGYMRGYLRGYLRDHSRGQVGQDRGPGVHRYYPWFLIFVAGMYAIVTVTDLMFFFFAAWQLMTIPSFALVRFERDRPENVRAAWRYLVMMQLSCALVLAAAFILGRMAGPVGSLETFDFERISAAMPTILAANGKLAALAFLLFLVGFGIKAGMWPFGQLWLPDAHPAAPSPVSALLSGVMIKTGVYGLLRTFLWLVPSDGLADFPTGAWGALIAVLGTATLFIGTLQALKQEETKRLLAFHSIGQVGYILLGLGACLALFPREQGGAGAVATLAAIAIYGALFHTVNHALFKSLLFLDAGSILCATGTQDLNKLGGLMRFMPITGATALVASFSIAGVPLFNGFASKWSIYVAALLGKPAAAYLPILGVVAIITSGLTLASFMKFFGASFLSPVSTLVAGRAAATPRLEVSALLTSPKLLLAALCLLLGVVPGLAYVVIGRVLEGSPGGLASSLAKVPLEGTALARGLEVAGGKAALAPLALLGVLAALFALASAIARLGRSTRREAAPWLCGYAREADCHRYSAHNMYTEFKRYFDWVGGKRRDPASGGKTAG